MGAARRILGPSSMLGGRYDKHRKERKMSKRACPTCGGIRECKPWCKRAQATQGWMYSQPDPLYKVHRSDCRHSGGACAKGCNCHGCSEYRR